jgi:ribosomal protein L17
MKYLEMLRKAKELFGGSIKGHPKKIELEKLFAEEAEERRKRNDPVSLKAKAEELRRMSEQLATTAKAVEERAQAITLAQEMAIKATAGLFSALVAFKDAVGGLVGLGLEYEYPSPITAKWLESAIATLTPPKRIYAFWAEGRYPVGRGYILAESFEAARQRCVAGEVDCGQSWTAITRCSDGSQEARRVFGLLTENGAVESSAYRTTVRTATLDGSHIFLFVLDGPEYEGKAVVVANDFATAKTKALTGDIVEGDKPEMEPDELAELRKALNALQENGRVEHMGHGITTQTLI